MGRTSRAIMAGVGAGLTTFGQGMMRQEETRLRHEREDARLETTDAFKERELDLREAESELRQKAMKRQGQMDQAKIDHANLLKGFADSGTNMEQVGQVISKSLPDDKQWHYNDSATKQQGAFAVFDIGYRKQDPATGGFIPDPVTGLPMERPSPVNNGQQVFKTQEEWTARKALMINPLYAYSLIVQEKTADIRFEEAKKLQEFVAKTPEGVAGLAKTKAQTDESIARAQKLRAEAGDTQKVSPLAKIKEQGMNQFANNLTKELGVSVSATTAKKIASISDDKKVRGAFHKAVTNALNPDNPTTRSDFIESGITQGLPREFMERFYSNAERSYEERGEETDALSDGWFKNMFDSVLGIFTDSDPEAPILD